MARTAALRHPEGGARPAPWEEVAAPRSSSAPRVFQRQLPPIARGQELV